MGAYTANSCRRPGSPRNQDAGSPPPLLAFLFLDYGFIFSASLDASVPSSLPVDWLSGLLA